MTNKLTLWHTMHIYIISNYSKSFGHKPEPVRKHAHIHEHCTFHEPHHAFFVTTTFPARQDTLGSFRLLHLHCEELMTTGG